MFRNLTKFVAIVIGLVLVVWGSHGLYVYFDRLEVLFGTGVLGSKLFGAITVPHDLVKYVDWMTIKGFQSWFVPGVFVAAGVGLWWWQKRWVWR